MVDLNAEYRWEAFSGLDMALFYGLGKVAPSVGDLELSRSRRTRYGIGFRFNTYKSVLFRVDIGFGGAKASSYFFKFSKAF